MEYVSGYNDARLSELHSAFTKLVREHRIDSFDLIFVIDKREYSVAFSEQPSVSVPQSPDSSKEPAIAAQESLS